MNTTKELTCAEVRDLINAHIQRGGIIIDSYGSESPLHHEPRFVVEAVDTTRDDGIEEIALMSEASRGTNVGDRYDRFELADDRITYTPHDGMGGYAGEIRFLMPSPVIPVLTPVLADVPEDMPNVSTPPAPHHPDLARLTVDSI